MFLPQLSTLQSTMSTRREETKQTVKAVITARFLQADGIFLALTKVQMEFLKSSAKAATAHLPQVLDEFLSAAQDNSPAAAEDATPTSAKSTPTPTAAVDDVLDLGGLSFGSSGTTSTSGTAAPSRSAASSGGGDMFDLFATATPAPNSAGNAFPQAKYVSQRGLLRGMAIEENPVSLGCVQFCF
jgi:hypothetical protein